MFFVQSWIGLGSFTVFSWFEAMISRGYGDWESQSQTSWRNIFATMFLLWIDQMMAGARRNAGCWSKNRPNTQGHDGAGDGDEDGAGEKRERPMTMMVKDNGTKPMITRFRWRCVAHILKSQAGESRDQQCTMNIGQWAPCWTFRQAWKQQQHDAVVS